MDFDSQLAPKEDFYKSKWKIEYFNILQSQ